MNDNLELLGSSLKPSEKTELSLVVCYFTGMLSGYFRWGYKRS